LNHPHDSIKSILAGTWLGRAVVGSGLLAAHLDGAWRPDIWLFFPLWLGYILVVDALVSTRAGNSLWSRSRKSLCCSFVFGTDLVVIRIDQPAYCEWQYLAANCSSPRSSICFAQSRSRLSFRQYLKPRADQDLSLDALFQFRPTRGRELRGSLSCYFVAGLVVGYRCSPRRKSFIRLPGFRSF
jgi:hypothetical protein